MASKTDAPLTAPTRNVVNELKNGLPYGHVGLQEAAVYTNGIIQEVVCRTEYAVFFGDIVQVPFNHCQIDQHILFSGPLCAAKGNDQDLGREISINPCL